MTENKKNPDNPEKKKKEAPQEKMVARKYVLFITIDEEITDIFDKIKQTRLRNIYLMVPEGAMLFHSSVNLMILSEKAAKKKKKISIITQDKSGIALCQQANIPVFKKLDLPKKNITITESSEMAIAPIMAMSNETEDEAPKRISKKKISIRDLVYKRRSVSSRSDSAFSPPPKVAPPPRRKTKKAKELPSVLYLRPTKRTIVTLLSISVMLLLLISYVALPGATIQLWPRSSVIQRSLNVSFLNAAKNKRFLTSSPKHTIGTVPITSTVTYDLTYKSTGQVFAGTNAEGTITIVNKRPTPWTLVSQTRFQSPDGLIFRLQKEVTVPAARGGNDGTVEALVRADDKDTHDQVIGAKGNIPPSTFFLPGLRESSRETLFAKSTRPFVGGTTDVTIVALPEDIEAARQAVAKKVKEAALQSLDLEVAKYNNDNDSQLILLKNPKALSFGDIQYLYDESIANKAMNTFVMSATIPVKGVMYERKRLFADLSESLEAAKTPGKVITDIDLDSLTFNIFEKSDSLETLKATIGIQGVEQFTLDLEDESSKQLIKKIKDRVKGLSVDEAEMFIQNLPEINKVRIKAWPFWSPRLPHLIENISIAIVAEPY